MNSKTARGLLFEFVELKLKMKTRIYSGFRKHFEPVAKIADLLEMETNKRFGASAKY